MQVSEGALLGGRLRYMQPIEGYRTGIEPVLLAASVPARAGERVLEAGTGAGAGLMCLAARVPGIIGVGLEIDPAMAALARRNFAANGFAALDVIEGDVVCGGIGPFDHVFANPPWHDRGSTASPLAGRRLAKQEQAGLEAWIAALAKMTTGSLTLILPAAQTGRATALMAEFGAVLVHTLRPKAGRAAKLVLIQASRGVWSCRGEAETVLHEDDGGFTPGVEAVLRQGATLRAG